MANPFAMCKAPTDPAGLDRHGFGKHVPLAKRRLRRCGATTASRVTVAGSSPRRLIATPDFDSPAAIQSAPGSSEKPAATADLAFAEAEER